MIPIEKSSKKKIIFHIRNIDGKGAYPLRRALLLADVLQQQADIVFLHHEASPSEQTLYKQVTYTNFSSLLQVLQHEQPDVFIRDSGSSNAEEVEQIRQLVPAIIHFDDFGDGGEQADLVIQTLYAETVEQVPEHYVRGAQTYIADHTVVKRQGIGKQKTRLNPLPHLIIFFGHKDESNLSYRTLRHVKQLQIPLRVTVLVGEQYTHDISDLQMMALSRRNTIIQKVTTSTDELWKDADLVVCGSGYLPYEIAVMGIPCIVLAQNEFELSLDFPKEAHGFVHLGLGRKIKQSTLLNAIMEPLLHEHLHQKAIERQLNLNIGNGKEKVVEAIQYFLEYPRTRKAQVDVLH